MSFLNKIKGRGPKDDVALPDATGAAAKAFDGRLGSEGPPTDVVGGPGYDVPTLQQNQDPGASIISEAAPSEMADFSETRIQEDPLVADAAGTGLPIIGNRPVAEQQRVLFAMVALGLIGLILITLLSLYSANRGAAQVGASGQALMQSQRLAKSVSQALIGSAAAFPEV